MYATISADVVCSTKLSQHDMLRMKEHLEGFLAGLPKVSKGSWGRIVKGDAVECVLEKSSDALRVALLLKCHAKTFVPEVTNPDLSKYGMRIAIGIGPLRTNDQANGIIDGEAIYKSGRCIEGKRNLAKGTLYIEYEGSDTTALDVVVPLCDVVVNKATEKQCQVLCRKLMGLDESAVAEAIGKSRPTVNNQSMLAGWPALEKAVRYFESINM
ncbi:MAG: RNA polymerase subunit sigma-70 [Bacteroidales bacterium]|nr:RNA polymerase subunit sigma-70 [Bacteroidales bacterium]